MGICASTPKTHSTPYINSHGELMVMTVTEPTRAEKKSMRQEAKELKAEMKAMGFKNVKVTTSFR